MRALVARGHHVAAASGAQALLQPLEGACALPLTLDLADPRGLPMALALLATVVAPVERVVVLVGPAGPEASPGAALAAAVAGLERLGAALGGAPGGLPTVVVGQGAVGAGVAAWARAAGSHAGLRLSGVHWSADAVLDDDALVGVLEGLAPRRRPALLGPLGGRLRARLARLRPGA